MKARILCLILWSLLFTAPSAAHSPYIIKAQTLKDSQKESFIIERLYGDGIFGPDPVRLQIRNPQGAVIAYSSTAVHVSYFCPSLEYCWAFPYDDFIVKPERLEYEKLDFHTGTEISASTEFKEYCTKASVTHIKSPEAVYPLCSSSKCIQQNFKPASELLTLLSPFIIASDNLFLLFILGLFYFIPAFFISYLLKHLSKATKPSKGMTVLTSLLLIASGILATLVSLLILFATGLLISQVGAVILWIWLGKFCTEKAYRYFNPAGAPADQPRIMPENIQPDSE